MPEINKQQAEEFLSNISKEDNVAIIHHDDGDGVCSGIILNEHCIKQGATTKTFTYHLSKTKLSELDLSAFNKIIITDVSVKAIQEDIKSIKNTQIHMNIFIRQFRLVENACLNIVLYLDRILK